MEAYIPPPLPGNPVMVADPTLGRPLARWGAVLAGGAAALATQIGLSQLCISIGLAFYEPANPGTSISKVAMGGAVALVLSAIVSLFVGGLVAGRLARHSSKADAAIHGGLVWALCGIVGVVLVVTAVGATARGAVYLGGESINAVATGAAAVAPAAKELVAPTWDAVKAQVEGEAAKADKDKPSDDRLAERSRLMELLASSFSPDSSAEQKQTEKKELTAVLASQTGVSPAAAGRAYDQWQRAWQEATARFEAKKLEAEAKAKQVAAAVAERTSQAALYAFLATLIGLVAAGAGALLGRASACRRDEVGYTTSRWVGPTHSELVLEKGRSSAGLAHSTR